MKRQPQSNLKQNSLVSVIMPVYNGASYLSETIESILNQTYKNFELLILDDFSADSSIEIIQSFKDKRIKLFTNKSNQGYIAGLNFLVQKSKGEFIARNDQDDISLPERLYKQLKFFEINPNLSILGGQIHTIGKYVRKVSYPVNNGDCRSQLLFNTCLHHPTVIFKRKKIEKFISNLYDESKSPSEDYDLWAKLSLSLMIENIPDIILKYRIHQNNYSTLQQEKQFKNNLIIREEYFKHYLKMSISKNENILMNKIIYNHKLLKEDFLVLVKFFKNVLSFSKKHNDYLNIKQTISFYWLKSIMNSETFDFQLITLLVKNIKLVSLKIFFNAFYIKKILHRI